MRQGGDHSKTICFIFQYSNVAGWKVFLNYKERFTYRWDNGLWMGYFPKSLCCPILQPLNQIIDSLLTSYVWLRPKYAISRFHSLVSLQVQSTAACPAVFDGPQIPVPKGSNLDLKARAAVEASGQPWAARSSWADTRTVTGALGTSSFFCLAQKETIFSWYYDLTS